MTRSTAPDGSIVLRFAAAGRWAGGIVSASVVGVLITIGWTARAEGQAQTKAMVEIKVEMRHIGGTITDHEARIRTLEYGGD